MKFSQLIREPSFRTPCRMWHTTRSSAFFCGKTSRKTAIRPDFSRKDRKRCTSPNTAWTGASGNTARAETRLSPRSTSVKVSLSLSYATTPRVGERNTPDLRFSAISSTFPSLSRTECLAWNFPPLT